LALSIVRVVPGEDSPFRLGLQLGILTAPLDNILPSRINLVMFACLAVEIAFGQGDLYATGDLSPGGDPDRKHPRSVVRGLDLVLYANAVVGILLATPPPQEVIENVLLSPSSVPLPQAVSRAVSMDDPIAHTYPYATEFSLQPMQRSTMTMFGSVCWVAKPVTRILPAGRISLRM
jgi:hypothetical protein